MVTKITQIPYKIGITGTVASGKSLVGSILQEAGVPVLDTDKVVAQLYEEDASLKADLFQAFGTQIRTLEGQVDKKALREIVFNDLDKLSRLESLVHPKVAEKVKAFLEDKAIPGPLRAVLVPLLFEAKTEKSYDEVWSVVVKQNALLERLKKRDNISDEEAQKRVKAQWPQEQKAAKATRVIDNSGTPEETKAQVLAILQEIREALPRCG